MTYKLLIRIQSLPLLTIVNPIHITTLSVMAISISAIQLQVQTEADTQLKFNPAAYLQPTLL